MDTIGQAVREVEENIERAAAVSGRKPEEVRLMAVTKTVGPERINRAIACGVRLIGENKVQELLEKYEALDREGLEIHLIGHLQTNKVKYIIDKVDMIQSVDSLRLAQEIQKQAEKAAVTMKILVEVNIGGEQSKSGVSPGELEELLRDISQLPRVKVMGLMAIPPEGTPEEASRYFIKMHELFIDIADKKIDNVTMDFLSMGMSGDYQSAVACGSNLVRVGSAIFGKRPKAAL